MFDQARSIFTGGKGLLGGEFRRSLPDLLYPSTQEFDVTNYALMEEYLEGKNIALIIHAAAFTSPPRIDNDPMQAIDVNIIGTANIVKLCLKHAIKLIYISTDYVFKGDTGGYKEEDPVYPINKYAWSKLGGECAVKLYDNSLIVRTTFGPNVFPYEKAFIDQWTSRESVSIITGKIIALLDRDITGVIHVGGTRKTVFEFAQSQDEFREIKPLSIGEVGFKVPEDTSLNCDRYNTLLNK